MYCTSVTIFHGKFHYFCKNVYDFFTFEKNIHYFCAFVYMKTVKNISAQTKTGKTIFTKNLGNLKFFADFHVDSKLQV